MRVLSVASRYSDLPEEDIITISRIGDASCPRRYYKNYVETPRQPRPFESIELGLGQFFHSYLEAHFSRILAERREIGSADRIDLDDLLRQFRLSFLWEGKLREPYRIVGRTYTLDAFQHRLHTVGMNFNECLLRELLGHRIKSVEGQLQISTDACDIRGKHDLITVAPGRSLVLWDWKTGRRPKPEYFHEFESLKAQLGVYAIWMRYSYESTSVLGKAVFLRDTLEQQSERFTPPIEQDVLEYMTRWRARLNGMTSYPPVPSALCDWCSWNETCPAVRRQIEVPATAGTQDASWRSVTQNRPQPASNCFVATVAFGDPNCVELSILRRFRDTWLAPHRLGRLFLAFYYRIGPAAARWVARHPLVRRVTRAALSRCLSMLRRLLVGGSRKTRTNRKKGEKTGSGNYG